MNINIFLESRRHRWSVLKLKEIPAKQTSGHRKTTGNNYINK